MPHNERNSAGNDAIMTPEGCGEDGMRTPLMLLGILLVAAGLFFAGQGAGYVRYPVTSSMIDDSRWIYYGLGMAIFGALVFLMARQRD